MKVLTSTQAKKVSGGSFFTDLAALTTTLGPLLLATDKLFASLTKGAPKK